MSGSGHEERLVAAVDEAGLRIDVFLARRLPALSRSQIQRLIKSGHVTGNDRPIKNSAPVTAGLAVRVVVPDAEPAEPIAESLPIDILYDDADVVVINKPAGMVVHPAPGHSRGTVVNALLHHVSGLSGVGGKERPGIVHRLDRGTSGVMIIAKHDRAHRELSRQFHDRTVVKEYAALVWGRVEAAQTMDRPIGRDPRDRRKMSSRARRSRSALTTVLSVEAIGALSLVRLAIGTGRTHQIRVHLNAIGHPIVGDSLYGGVHRRVAHELRAVQRLDRPFLHAERLAFHHPRTGESLEFTAPLPDDLRLVLEEIEPTLLARLEGREIVEDEDEGDA